MKYPRSRDLLPLGVNMVKGKKRMEKMQGREGRGGEKYGKRKGRREEERGEERKGDGEGGREGRGATEEQNHNIFLLSPWRDKPMNVWCGSI